MKFSIKVPATSANLGPGFDALGLALGLWNHTTITPADEFQVLVSGEGTGRLTKGRNNLIIRAAQRLADRAGKTLPTFHAECVNAIPMSSGLGSSSAAILTGMLAANTLLRSPFSKEEVLNLATEIEGHPDNVAPALLGGLVVSTVNNGTVVARKIPVNMNVFVTVVLPDFYISTKQARAILPRKTSVKNAVHNISRAVLVTEAFRSGDLSLLGEAMTDKLHQPYRLKLIPGAMSAMEAAREAGAAAVALSGAGPSLIAFSSKMDSTVGEGMKRAFEKAKLKATVFNLGVSDSGTEVQTL